MDVQRSLDQLINYCERVGHRGYDPYDTLNSPLFRKLPGRLIPAVFIQIQKRLPINLRPVLGIQKGFNPKAMGLFLKAYTLLFEKTKEKRYLDRANYLFEWLSENYSEGYSGYAWGYNFDWASPGNYLKMFTPSVVVTSFVVDGINEYYRVTQKEKAAEIIISAANYIRKDIPVLQFKEGISFSYTHLSTGACYNASLLAAEVLSKAHAIKPNFDDVEKVKQAVQFVLSKQKDDGSWLYSLDPETNRERYQIDFHQGFILISLFNILNLLNESSTSVSQAIRKGLAFYYQNQFEKSGKSMWRLPKKWPVDIHNQSQGIITFSRLSEFNPIYHDFARTIASWTVHNMQSNKGFFYYRINPALKNRISFIRWGQAWMLLALTELYTKDK